MALVGRQGVVLLLTALIFLAVWRLGSDPPTRSPGPKKVVGESPSESSGVSTTTPAAPAAPSEVAEWLRGQALSEFAPAFASHRIGFDLFETLSDDDLARMGVSALGDRKRLLAAIKQWLAAHGKSPSPAPARPSDKPTATAPYELEPVEQKPAEKRAADDPTRAYPVDILPPTEELPEPAEQPEQQPELNTPTSPACKVRAPRLSSQSLPPLRLRVPSAGLRLLRALARSFACCARLLSGALSG